MRIGIVCHPSIGGSGVIATELGLGLARQVSGCEFKVVTTIHGTDATIVGHDRPLYPLNRFSIDQSDMVTTVSEYQKKYLLDFFDMVALEAMSSGVPPVCSDRDGVPEVTIHGETGFIADPDDHAALGGFLARICSEPALHKQLAENGRRRALKLFNSKDKVDEYLDNYNSCLAI